MSAPAPGDVRRTYVDGVESVAAISSAFSPGQWGTVVCGSWSGTDTARHLASVADWYHDWLDRALAGERSAPFAAADIDSMTSASLERYRDLNGAQAVERFGAQASSYLDRVDEHWDLPFSYPFGDVTAGLHAGIAAAEWHFHAWDLSGATTARHEPRDPGVLFSAAGACVAAGTGGLRGRALGLMVPLAARRSPWTQMLARAGRRV